MRKRTAIAAAVAGIAALAAVTELCLIGHTEMTTDSYPDFHPTHCAPVSAGNVSWAQRQFLNNPDNRFVVNAIGKDGDALRSHDFIVSRSHIRELGLRCDLPREETRFSFGKVCRFTTKGQYFPGIVLPRTYAVTCRPITPEETRVMSDRLSAQGADTSPVYRMYR